jgi:hypothetical protein
MITITELTEDIEAGDQLLIFGNFSPYGNGDEVQLLKVK